jgi:transposase InsO family protein
MVKIRWRRFLVSNYGPEFVAEVFQNWLAHVGIKPIRIYPASPWENGYNERFNGTLRRDLGHTVVRNNAETTNHHQSLAD